MIINKMTEAIIYEMKDGTTSVYIQKPGDHLQQQKLDGNSEQGLTLREQVKETELWHSIRQAAKTNPMLQRALDEVVLLYKLSR